MAPRRKTFGRISKALAVLAAGTGCSSEPSARVPDTSIGTADRCIVRLHGKGGEGAASTLHAGIVTVRPAGNESGWGKRQWLYFPDDRYEEARAIVTSALDRTACTSAVIAGFSNGASFAAKLYCRGETFDGRVVGYVIDDPVTDAAVAICRPASGVKAALYWTGALGATAPAGTKCSSIDWTCEDGVSLGIESYAAALDLPVQQSPNIEHVAYEDAPEIRAWLD